MLIKRLIGNISKFTNFCLLCTGLIRFKTHEYRSLSIEESDFIVEMVKSEGLSNERFVFWVQTSPNMYTPLKNMSNLNHRYFCSRFSSEVHLKMLHLIKKAQYTSSVLHSKLVTNENVNSLLISGESLLVSLSSIEGQSTFTRSLFTNSMKII